MLNLVGVDYTVIKPFIVIHTHLLRRHYKEALSNLLSTKNTFCNFNFKIFLEFHVVY